MNSNLNWNDWNEYCVSVKYSFTESKHLHSSELTFRWSICRMTSTCLVESWRGGRPTSQTSCGCLTSPPVPGHHGNQLLFMLWRATQLMWWSCPMATRWCWSSSATRPSTATSIRFRSTTSVSALSGTSLFLSLFKIVLTELTRRCK